MTLTSVKLQFSAGHGGRHCGARVALVGFGLSIGVPCSIWHAHSLANQGRRGSVADEIARVARLLYTAAMRSATFPPIRVEPKVRSEVEAVLREGESLTQFIEEAVVSAAAWRRVQAEFVARGEAAIERWKREGGRHSVDAVMGDLQTRLDDAKRQAAKRAGR
jgi:hypothetical protein